ncbi:MAG: hypothetical protein AAGA56_11345 [Myxococcota bacterium]
MRPRLHPTAVGVCLWVAALTATVPGQAAPPCERACRLEGRCARSPNRCRATTHTDCRFSRLCTDEGRCFVDARAGVCRAGTTTDCTASAGCGERGLCTVHGPTGTCVASEARSKAVGTAGVVALGLGAIGLTASPLLYNTERIGMSNQTLAIYIATAGTFVLGGFVLYAWGYSERTVLPSTAIRVGPTHAAFEHRF